MFREMKAKKAKYGFKEDFFTAESIVPFGVLISALRAEFDTVKFTMNLDTNMGRREFILYTDHDDVAEFVRKRMFAVTTEK